MSAIPLRCIAATFSHLVQHGFMVKSFATLAGAITEWLQQIQQARYAHALDAESVITVLVGQ